MNDNKWVSRIRSLAKHIVVRRHLLCLGTDQTTSIETGLSILNVSLPVVDLILREESEIDNFLA